MTKNIIAELERTYGTLNSHLFSGKLRTPEFVMQFLKKKSIFKFIPEPYQIIVAGDLGNIALRSLFSHLLHEMVHISNYMDGVLDCRLNQYHNKEFMVAALKVGLICVKHRSHGWVTTDATNTLDAIIPDKEIIEKRNKAFAEINFDKLVLRQSRVEFCKKSPKRMYCLKYECNCQPPHNSIRSGRRPDGAYPPKIRCEECGCLFVCAEV
jgi:hypothetical protein